MREKPDYLMLAVRHPMHQAVLVALVIGLIAALWRQTWWPLLAAAVAEGLYLLLMPASPAFRRACDQKIAAEARYQRRVALEKVALHLSPAAKSRLDGIQRMRARILDAMRTLSDSDALGREWEGRLEALGDAALRILVSVDATPADARDERRIQSDVKELEEEIARLPDGPARAAKRQRLELARKRLSGQGALRESREAAVTQLETLEDLLQELLSKGLSGRDSAAFAARADALSAQIDAAGESIGALDRAAEGEAELKQLKGA